MSTNMEDHDNLDLILLKCKQLHGVVFHKEIKALVERFPNAFGFTISHRAEGEIVTLANTKVKTYHKSDKHVFVLYKESEVPGQRKNAKNKKFHRTYLRFNHNESKPSEEASVEEE